MSKWRFAGNAMLTLITKIGCGYWHIMDPQNGYTAISKHALEIIDLDSIYPYYGYCNDMLIKLNTFELRVMILLCLHAMARKNQRSNTSAIFEKWRL